MCKCHYTCSVVQKLLAANETDSGMPEFWHKFYIADVLPCMKKKKKQDYVPKSKAGWRKIWPSVVNDVMDFPPVESQIQQIVDLARRVPDEIFEDMPPDDISELLEDDDKELSTKEMLQELNSQLQRTKDEDEEPEP